MRPIGAKWVARIATPPFFFAKPADAVVPLGGYAIPYPSATSDFHHEVELVVALGQGGEAISSR